MTVLDSIDRAIDAAEAAARHHDAMQRGLIALGEAKGLCVAREIVRAAQAAGAVHDVRLLLDLVGSFDVGSDCAGGPRAVRLVPCAGVNAGRWIVTTGMERLTGPCTFDVAVSAARALVYVDHAKLDRLVAAIGPGGGGR